MASKKNGTIQELGPHGEVMKETEYVDGKKHGTQTCYDPDGNPVKITTFENNNRVYEETYYKGQLVSKTSYFNGKKEGKCELYENGVKTVETFYANGKKDGMETHYHPNGVVSARYQYHCGKRDFTNREEYHSNGQPSKIVHRTEDGIITDTEYRMPTGIPTAQYITRDDGTLVKSNHFYLSGVIGRTEFPGDTADLYFDPKGNQISSDEFYSTQLSKHVGWGNWNYPEVTELDYVSRRDAEAATRRAKYQSELRDFGTAWTKPLKITPIRTSDTTDTTEMTVISQPRRAAVITQDVPVHTPNDTSSLVDYSQPIQPRTTFLSKLLAKLF